MSTITTITKSGDFEMFDMVMKNVHTVGGKVMADIPLKLLAVGDYQRVEYCSEEKIQNLATNFNKNLMDPLKVSAHPEEALFYMVDGYHRERAIEINGKETSVACEILQDLSDDPKVRRVQEADLFRRQHTGNEPLKPVAMHKANLICGETSSWYLDQAVTKYGFRYKTNQSRGRCPENTLTGFSTALRIAESYGKEMLNDIFYVLHKSMWSAEAKGLGDIAISMLRNIYIYDPTSRENKDIIIEILKNMSPKLLEADAISKYKLRGAQVACSLYLEDLIAEKIPLDKNLHAKYGVGAA